MIYDGRVIHGVQEIDTMDPLDLTSFGGRHVALVTLFKDFSAGEDYKKLHDEPIA